MRILAALVVCSCAASSPGSPAPAPAPAPVPAPAPAPAPVAVTEVDASTATVIDAGVDAEVTASVVADVDAAAPVARTVDVKLPGKCVDPIAHAESTYKDGFKIGGEPSPIGDLDGDGVDDVIVFGGATNITSDKFVYVMRGKCGHFVGKLVNEAVGLSPTTSKQRGLFDMKGIRACRVACCPSTVEYSFRFDGTSYRQVSATPAKRSCSGFP